jgi:hypothetical protein
VFDYSDKDIRSRLESAATEWIKRAKLISSSTNGNERLAVRLIHLHGFEELVHCVDTLMVRLLSRVFWPFWSLHCIMPPLQWTVNVIIVFYMFTCLYFTTP